MIPTRTATLDAPPHLTLHGLSLLTVPGRTPARLERKQAAILAYVRREGSTSRGRLAALLWPAATASGARSNLRQCLGRLRRISSQVLEEHDDAVALAPGVVVGAPAEGDPDLLDGHDYSDCDDFARWLRSCIDEDRAARHVALLAAFRAAIDAAEFARAQSHADSLLSLDRESEDPYRALMEVAYLRGDFAAAVRAWGRCRDMLRQLYGVAPSHATEALGAVILAAAPAASPGSAWSGGRPPSTEPRGPLSAMRAGAPGNLPLALPMLYGRAGDLASLRSTLRDHRLVTVIGIGGIGKTTLAMAAAHADRAAWSEGVWFVDLTAIQEPANVATTVARVLGVRLPAEGGSVNELALALRHSRLLLVIDNAEHVWKAVAALASALLADTAHLHLLVTSRRALRVAQEQRVRLAGLDAPEHPDLANAAQRGALDLFAARVSAIDARFRLTDANAATVADVCRRLDGLPLAIELAASRVPVLGVDGLRARLNQSLRVLGTSATIGAPRHETLRATFDWTHDLLTNRQQRLLRRLAVFAGGFTLALAEAIDAIDALDGARGAPALDTQRDPLELLDDLTALVEGSLVVAGESDPPRYRLLEVTRAYGLEKLAEAGELESVSTAHAAAVLRRFEAAESDLNEKTEGASTRGDFLNRLRPEIDNLRAALAWSRDRPDHALGIALAATSTEAMRLLGLSTEALNTMLAWRASVDETMPPAIAELFWTGLCALGTHGRLSREEIRDVIERAERLYRRVGSARRIHVGLYRKGFALLHLGLANEVQRCVDEMESLERPTWPARAIALRLNLQGAADDDLGRIDPSIAAYTLATRWVAADPGERDVVLNVRGNLCMSLLRAERYEEALATAHEILADEPSPVVRILALRGAMVALTFMGRLDEAMAVVRQAMNDWVNDDMLAHMLSVVAWLACLQQRLPDAFRLDGAASIKAERTGLFTSPVFDRARQRLESALPRLDVPPDVIAAWRHEGRLLDRDGIVACCLGTVPAAADVGRR